MIEGIQTDMGRWEVVDFNNLPQPENRVPLTLEEYDYKTYWVGRFNEFITEKNTKNAVVYLLTDGSQVKIGVSGDLEQRLRNLQTGTGRKIELLAKYGVSNISVAKRIENLLHKHYDQYRLYGEWFDMQVGKEEWLSLCGKFKSSLKKG